MPLQPTKVGFAIPDRGFIPVNQSAIPDRAGGLNRTRGFLLGFIPMVNSPVNRVLFRMID